MPGPPPTPTHLKLLRGNPGQRRLRTELEPARGECPDPPSFVTGVAADEWWRIAGQLHVLGLLTTLDVMPLAIYCTSYAHWREAEEALARMAEHDENTRAMLVRSAEGTARANPLLKIAREAGDAMLAAAREFGLTPTARARIANGPGWQPPGDGGKFGGLLT